jgi:hypothetical protein
MTDKGKSVVCVKINGKFEDIELDEVWDEICKVLRSASLVIREDKGEILEARINFLNERFHDLRGVYFRYKRSKYSPVFEDIFSN